MSRHYEIVRQSLDLVETMGEEIGHIRSKFAQGEFEDSLPLLEKVTESLLCVLEAGFLVLGEERFCALSSSARALEEGLDVLAAAYEGGD